MPALPHGCWLTCTLGAEMESSLCRWPEGGKSGAAPQGPANGVATGRSGCPAAVCGQHTECAGLNWTRLGAAQSLQVQLSGGQVKGPF